MKKLILPALLGLAALASMPAQAATATDTFTVTVTFNSKCTVTRTGNASLVVNDAQAGASATPTNAGVDVWCTKGLSYGLSLDGAGSPDFVSSSGAVYRYADPVALTTYELTLSGTTGTGSATGLSTPYTVAPSFVSTTCTSTSCSNSAAPATRTLTVTY
jgi:hypothetical protein